jgi:hypothetical protein
MIKLLVTAVTWFIVSNGLVAASTWLVNPEPTAESARVATDAYCRRGNWPDRARACTAANRPATLKNVPQAIETPNDLERLAAHSTAQLSLRGRVQFYDASTVAEASAKLDAPIATVPMPLASPRTVQALEPVNTAADNDAARKSTSAAEHSRHKLSRSARLRRPASTPRRIATAELRRSPMVRIYGVTF